MNANTKTYMKNLNQFSMPEEQDVIGLFEEYEDDKSYTKNKTYVKEFLKSYVSKNGTLVFRILTIDDIEMNVIMADNSFPDADWIVEPESKIIK